MFWFVFNFYVMKYYLKCYDLFELNNSLNSVCFSPSITVFFIIFSFLFSFVFLNTFNFSFYVKWLLWSFWCEQCSRQICFVFLVTFLSALWALYLPHYYWPNITNSVRFHNLYNADNEDFNLCSFAIFVMSIDKCCSNNLKLH